MNRSSVNVGVTAVLVGLRRSCLYPTLSPLLLSLKPQEISLLFRPNGDPHSNAMQ